MKTLGDQQEYARCANSYGGRGANGGTRGFGHNEKRPRAYARDRFICDPSGIRTRVTAVRGQRTRPLYDGAAYSPEQHFCRSR